MNQHANRRKRAIVLTVARPVGSFTRPAGGRYARSPYPQAGLTTAVPLIRTAWFRASAAAVLVAALLMPIGHARADGSLITTAVQVSLKIQQSCQIDSSDAAGGAVAGVASGAASASTTGSPSTAAAATPSSGADGTSKALASTSAGQGSDSAPKVSCQFDEPYGVLSSTTTDFATRPISGRAVPADGTIQVASWTVLF